jgi:hypothetical protein
LVLGVLIFGLVASSPLVIGAVAGAYLTPPTALLASALAFGLLAGITLDGIPENMGPEREKLTSEDLKGPQRAD